MIKHKGHKDKISFFNVKFKGIDGEGANIKRNIIRGGAVAAILIIACGGIFALKTAKSISGSGKGIDRSEYIVLKEGRAINTEFFLGEIKTEDYMDVSSKFSNCLVTEVNVSLGDRVKAGDVLAKINSEDAQKEIDSLKEENSIALNKKNKLLEQKRIDYEGAVKEADEESNAEVVLAKRNLYYREYEVSIKKEEYEEACSNGETAEVIDNAKKAYETAQEERDLARLQLENLREKLQLAVENAKKVYELQKMEVDDPNTEAIIQKKTDELSKYDIKAPIDGVVIEVRAEVGRVAEGVLFRIQNMDNQIVQMYIREGEQDKLEVGQSAVIQPMLTGKSSMTGVITNIEPITNIVSDNKVNLKDSKIGADASYIGEIAIDKFEDVLKDETQVRVEVTTDDREHVFRVPLIDIMNEDDKSYIYSAEKQGEDYVVKKLYVTLGNKGNLDVEISGDEIKEGIIILNNPQNYQPDSIIKITD